MALGTLRRTGAPANMRPPRCQGARTEDARRPGQAQKKARRRPARFK